MRHVENFETTNETFHFKFDSKQEEFSNSALYITIKKAFTPFASIHMLKQLIMAANSEYEIDEV
jgi:hypothetical protein